MNRRTFLKSLAVTAAGVLVPGRVLAEPERRVWALDQTMTSGRDEGTHIGGYPLDANYFQRFAFVWELNP